MKKYEDIINLPHHVSTVRGHMAIEDRAAQFAPFAALTGHDAAIKETGRLTYRRMELDDNAKALLDERLAGWRPMIEQAEREYDKEYPKVKVTCFIPDERKSGGRYVEVEGILKKIAQIDRCIVLEPFEWENVPCGMMIEKGTIVISVDDILELEKSDAGR